MDFVFRLKEKKRGKTTIERPEKIKRNYFGSSAKISSLQHQKENKAFPSVACFAKFLSSELYDVAC